MLRKFSLISCSFFIIGFFSCTKKDSNINNLASKMVRVSSDISEINKDGLSKTKIIIKTTHGSIYFSFYSQKAPLTSNRIFNLIKDGFYDGLKFHRVIPNYIIQTGSPTTEEFSGSGQTIKHETNDLKHEKGSIALVKKESESDSGDSQFYISLGSHNDLNGKYTIFAKVTEGLDILNKIEKDDLIISMDIIQ